MKLKEVQSQESQGPKYEVTWLKARKDLVESGETFCIDLIAKGKKPDDHGNFFWFLRLKKDGMDYETERWMTKIQVGNEKRDKKFADLQEGMKKEKGEGKDGMVHGCKLVELEGNFIILEALQHGTCPCGAENLDDTPGYDDDLGDLGDHPF